MGIKGLGKFLRENSLMKDGSRRLREYAGSTFFIDMSLILYEFVFAMKMSGKDDPDQKLQQYGVLQKTFQFIEADIRPVYVFDGKPSAMKDETISARKEVHDKRIESGDKHHMLKPTDDLIERIKYILTELNVEWIQAESEADITIARLVSKFGETGYAYTRDLDVLTFGAERVVVRDGTNYNTYRLNSLGGVTVIKYEKIGEDMTEIALDRSAFISLCILFGCDYMNGIRGIGHKTAEKIVLALYASGGKNFINLLKDHLSGMKNVTKEMVDRFMEVHTYFMKATALDRSSIKLSETGPRYRITEDLMVFLDEMSVKKATVTKWQKIIRTG